MPTQKLRSLFDFGMVLGGIGLASYGAWLAWHPGGFIFPGLMLTVIGLFA